MAELTIQQAFEIAVRQHRAGQLQDAESLYRQILTYAPSHAHAAGMLGQLSYQRGRMDEAEGLFRKAVSLNPGDADNQNNLGAVLATRGKFDEAVASFSQALMLRPAYPEAYNNLGNALRAGGKLEQAIQAYRKAVLLRPNYSDARDNLENALQEQGRAGEGQTAVPPTAEQHVEAPPVQLAPVEIPAFEESAGASEPAESVSPEQEAAEALQQVPQSELVASGAIEMESQEEIPAPGGMLEPESELSAAQREELDSIRQIDEAVMEFVDSGPEPSVAPEPELEPGPEPAIAPVEEPESVPEAAALVEGSAEAEPQTAGEFKARGQSRWEIGRYGQAAADYQAALDLEPDDIEARTKLGLLRLMEGDFQRGWPAYESRVSESGSAAPLTQPLWDGSDLHNHRILLHQEKGQADTIQFIRYAPMVAQRGGRVIVRCQPELKNLLHDQPGILLLLSTADPMPKFFTHAPLSSLPRIFGTTPETIPSDVPYLLSDSKLADQWYARISQEPGGLKVGLALRGDEPNANDSPPASVLAEFVEASGARFYLLQPSPGAGTRETPPLDLVDWTSELKDLAQTAALISNLDLVITSDNIIAHLAGALGRPVWMLLPFVADWRWMADRSDSPWYPTIRLFRQARAGRWDEPVRDLVRELRSHAEQHQPT